MKLVVNGKEYYRTSEACQLAGISRSTFLRWVKAGIIRDALHRDRRGWRIFSLDDITRIKYEATKEIGSLE